MSFSFNPFITFAKSWRFEIGLLLGAFVILAGAHFGAVLTIVRIVCDLIAAGMVVGALFRLITRR